MAVITQTTPIEVIEDILFNNAQVSISVEERIRVGDCFEFLKKFAEGKVIYGINTGFGPMAQRRIDDHSLRELQYNIIRSHSTGAGKPLDDIYVRAAMLTRLGTFVQARSGVHADLLDLIIEFINKGICPLIPEHGSVGASGDLVQLAHIALTLIGEGEVHYKGEWISAAQVFSKERLKPFDIHLREGLAMTNGTSVMTGIGLVNLIYAGRLLNWSVVASVLMNEIASSYDDLMDCNLNAAKRHSGQIDIAAVMRNISDGSRCVRKREEELYSDRVNGQKVFDNKVQAYYSLRCVPQILGPVFETLQNAARILVEEFNSACDNPIVDPSSENVYHGGNFHGDYISLEMDKMKIAITKLTMLTERQLNYLMHDRINGILPPFVNMGILGLNYGMQAAQFTATSTTAECQMLSNPMYVHSIPSNNDNQDIVSMGTNAALITKTVIENSFQVMAIHLMALAQAVDCLKIKDNLAPATRRVYDSLRDIFPVFTEDSPLYGDVEKIKKFIMNKDFKYFKL